MLIFCGKHKSQIICSSLFLCIFFSLFAQLFFKGDKSKLAYVTQLLVVKLLMVERLIWFLSSSISAFCHVICFCINSNFMAISNKML